MCPGLADLSISGGAPLSTEHPILDMGGGPVRSFVPWPEFSAKQPCMVRFVSSLFLNLPKEIYIQTLDISF